MKPMWTGLIFLLAFATIAVAVTIPFVYYFRKQSRNNRKIAVTTTVKVSSTTTKIDTTTVMSSTTPGSTSARTNTTTTVFNTTSGHSSRTTSTIQNMLVTTYRYLVNLIDSSPTLNTLYNDYDDETYYETVQISVSVTGNYTIESIGFMNTVGYLYINNINLDILWMNLFSFGDEGGARDNFRIREILEASQNYILLVTTYDVLKTGSFQILVTGPGTANITKVNVSSATNIDLVNSGYFSTLTDNNLKFCRMDDDCINGTAYYYKLIQLNIFVDGAYSIVSFGDIDIYAYLYHDFFSSTNIAINYLRRNGEHGDSNEFRLICYLRATIKYILVVTTSYPWDTGDFVIRTIGPATISYID